MKNILFAAACAILLAPPLASAQDVESALQKFDAAYWQAYNQCDVATMEKMSADDLEFYHDQGGVMKGVPAFAAAMKNNICGNPNLKVRREAVAGTVRVYPMQDKGKVYGAVMSGDHQFYNTRNGAETPGSRARFTHLLVLKDGEWKVSRVLSYDHAAPKFDNKTAAMSLSAAELALFNGTYLAKDKMVLTVKNAEDHLLVNAGGALFKLYPSSKNTFFLKERPITAAFSQDASGKGTGLVVRENGSVVAEATAVN
ncbi:nuclear transport factor 2 family protein [Massilia sp. R2A-15]|uniref:nuclear transport factor 2 family protein n=1 Tax=Massilia sp. R2A-15 TaxID=3064278 RepID=UPI002732CCDE|nr:nuclear transport factor 2 family protein [Massilia sp. R2A-15]WLI89556.1 nuclear transport factor 2 family protein [Massilia sp. R2A-15]